MSSGDADYWAKRREDLLRQMERDESALNDRLAKLYARQARELEREIAAYYQRYGEDNVIEYRNLLATLDPDDRTMLIERMDEFARRYPQYADLMPVRESIYRLNELEGIQESILMRMYEIGAIEQEELEEHFRRQAQRAANLAAEQMGFGENFYRIDSNVVAATVGQAWAKGESYSEAIWKDRERLAAYLNDDFAKMVARGAAYDKVAKALSERFARVSSSDMRRLVYTEGTFLFNEAQAQAHEGEFELYAISCVHDGKACQACKGLEREQKARPARFSEREPGVNFPPMHPWCRCSYTVEVEDWDAWIEAFVARRGGDAASAVRVAESFGGHLGKRFGHVEGLAPSEAVQGVRYDTSSQREVRRFIDDYSALIRNEPREHAYVLQADGTVRHSVGTVDAVSLEGAEMTGAIVVHNHPVDGGISVSLSEDDFYVLCEHQDAALYVAVSGDIEYSMKPKCKLSQSMYDECYRSLTFDELIGGEPNDLVMRKLHERGYIDYRRRDVYAE